MPNSGSSERTHTHIAQYKSREHSIASRRRTRITRQSLQVKQRRENEREKEEEDEEIAACHILSFSLCWSSVDLILPSIFAFTTIVFFSTN